MFVSCCCYPAVSAFLLLLFSCLLCPSAVAQLFLPSSPSLVPHSSTDCDCSSPKNGLRRPIPSNEHFRQQILQQQMEEAKKVKALVDMLNVRRKPTKTVIKMEKKSLEGAENNLELMMKTIEQKMRGQGEWKEDKKGQKKKKKGVAKLTKLTATTGEGGGKGVRKEEGKAEVHRAKRDSGPWGEQGTGPNSVLPLEEPLTPPDTERDGGATPGRCNSERIREIIRRAKGRDAAAIKRNIQAVAERQFDAKFNVICANADFSYISNTDEFCQDQVNGSTCYVFKQLERHRSKLGAEEEDREEGATADEEEDQFARQFAALGKRRRKRKRNQLALN